MTAPADLLGTRGENAFALEMLRPVPYGGSQAVLFEPIRLGDKAEGCDFLVIARTSDPLLQPSFFVQVKTTGTAAPLPNARVRVRCGLTSVRRLQATRVPVYVVAVDASGRTTERLYLAGITMTRNRGLAGVARAHSLSRAATKLALWNEVVMHYQTFVPGPYTSAF